MLHVRFAPDSGVSPWPSCAMNGSGENLLRKEKAARRRLPNSDLVIVDQAAIIAGFDFRR